MGGAYGEWTYRAPPGSSRTSGGTALPPASSVGQIYTPNPRSQALGRRPHIFSDLLGRPPGGVLAPSCSNLQVRALRQGGPPGNPPKSGWQQRLGGPEAPENPWRPLEAPDGPWRPLERLLEAPAPEARRCRGCWRSYRLRLRLARFSLGRSKKTIFSRWELRTLTGSNLGGSL